MAHLILKLKQRKSFLAQRAKLKWLKEGGVNSRLFHRAIGRGRASNKISSLELEGEWVTEPGRVKKAIFSHFRRRVGVRLEIPESLAVASLGEEEGARLVTEFTEEEMWAAVGDCDDNKSPGPDGFTACFYKSCWEIIKGDILRLFNEFHECGRLVRGSNSSFFVLIPKKEGQCGIGQFRPISLIRSMYKLVAKVLVNKIR